jgi:hypothetical protein
LWLAGVNRPELELRLGSKEAAIVTVILMAGLFYFAFAFIVRAVTIREVMSAFKRERGPPDGEGGLPAGLDG